MTKQNITLNIHGKTIPIQVAPEDEAKYREAAQVLNDRLNQYFAIYDRQKGTEDIYHYVLIDLALRYVTEREKNNTDHIYNVLSSLTKEIKGALGQN